MGLVHLQLSPSWLPTSSHERLRVLKDSFFLGGRKEFGACFARSQVPESSGSASPTTSCFQEFNVAREHKMCSPLVSRKGNQEHGPAGARFVLLDQAPRQLGMVETTQEHRFQECPSLDRTWSQGRVPKGSSLCAETFGAEIRRPARCGFRDSRSSQGTTDRDVSKPCSGGRTLPLQISSSHSSRKGQAAHRACPLNLNEVTVKQQTTYEDLLILKSVVRP